jgi:hypothetical protein
MITLKHLLLHTDYNRFPQKTVEELPEITTPNEIIKRPPYRNPSAYTVSVLTLLCDLGAHIDIDTRAFFESIRPHILEEELLLKGDYSQLPGIIDIQYRSLSYGSTSFGEKKNKNSRENTFGNQCTMRILFEDFEFDEGYNIINVKLFTNGTMQFTGITSVCQASDCIDILLPFIQRLINISKVHETIVDFRGGYNHIINFISNPDGTSTSNMEVFQKKKVLLRVIQYLGQKDIYRLALTCKFFWNLLSNDNNDFWISMNHYRFGVLHVFHPTIKNQLINVDTYKTVVSKISIKRDYFNRCERIANYKPNVLTTCVDPSNETVEMSNESIELINSNFNTGFFIDQRKLTKILQRQYPHLDSSYEPDDRYHGIKVYWPHPDTVQENGDNSNTVKIFISIFRTGSVLMSAAKTTQQLNDAYKFINGVLKENYDKIWIPNDT